MAMCHICKSVCRKAKGESWHKMMCKECYRITDHWTWDARWQITDYVKLNSIDLNMATP